MGLKIQLDLQKQHTMLVFLPAGNKPKLVKVVQRKSSRKNPKAKLFDVKLGKVMVDFQQLDPYKWNGKVRNARFANAPDESWPKYVAQKCKRLSGKPQETTKTPQQRIKEAAHTTAFHQYPNNKTPWMEAQPLCKIAFDIFVEEVGIQHEEWENIPQLAAAIRKHYLKRKVRLANLKGKFAKYNNKAGRLYRRNKNDLFKVIITDGGDKVHIPVTPQNVVEIFMVDSGVDFLTRWLTCYFFKTQKDLLVAGWPSCKFQPSQQWTTYKDGELTELHNEWYAEDGADVPTREHSPKLVRCDRRDRQCPECAGVLEWGNGGFNLKKCSKCGILKKTLA